MSLSRSRCDLPGTTGRWASDRLESVGPWKIHEKPRGSKARRVGKLVADRNLEDETFRFVGLFANCNGPASFVRQNTKHRLRMIRCARLRWNLFL